MAGQTTGQVAFSVSGMGCGGCAAGIQARLLATGGVKQARVDLARGLANIEYDPAVTRPQSLAAVISAAGYEVTQHSA
jgi:mercuric ion binding protein